MGDLSGNCPGVKVRIKKCSLNLGVYGECAWVRIKVIKLVVHLSGNLWRH